MFIASILWAFAAHITLAQEGDVLQAPPPIAFEQWRETGRREFYSEFSVSFPSAVRTGYPLNDVVRLRVTVPTDAFGPVPVVVLLHYWGASDTRFERGMAGRLAQSGIASVIVPLPYHLDRTPRGYRSGELAIQADLAELRATMIQSVSDVRRAVDWIESRPEFRRDQIGISGTSLGALIGALTFAVDSRIAASSYVLGGADIAHILWNSSRVVSQREALRKQGYTEARVREELRSVEPLEYLRPDDERPSFVIAARYDTVVPPADSRKLIDALGGAQALWLDTGHYGGALVQPKIIRTVVRFFDGTFRGTGFIAPKALYAPTIRLGMQANDESGLQVMAGLDVWKLRANAETFATVMLTPGGVQGFIGHTLSRNLALGVTVLPKRTTWGVMWSVVL